MKTPSFYGDIKGRPGEVMNLSQSHPVNKIPYWDVTQGHVSIQSL